MAGTQLVDDFCVVQCLLSQHVHSALVLRPVEAV